MLAWLVSTGLQFLSSGVLNQVFGYLEKKSDNDTEKTRIQSIRDQHAMDVEADVVKTGMSHKVFWVCWATAALPLCGWFGYGMINTMFPSLPHIATIPQGLLPWAQVVWSNIFYSGAGVLGATTLAQAIRNYK